MRQYFIHNGRTESGPFDFEQLKQMHIKQDSFVWYEGLQKWVRAHSIIELQDILSSEESIDNNLVAPSLDLSKKITSATNKKGKKSKRHVFNPDNTKKTALTIWIILSVLFLIAMYIYLKP